jgi:predicted sulfurtransferase
MKCRIFVASTPERLSETACKNLRDSFVKTCAEAGVKAKLLIAEEGVNLFELPSSPPAAKRDA